MAKQDETTVSIDDVWKEHLADVHVARHWAYIGGVLGGGFLAMVALMALLAGGA